MFKKLEAIYKRQCSGKYRYFFSPGRVNLIGEHTDYNGGHVFPCTISLGTYGVAGLNGTQSIRCYSANEESLGLVEVPLDSLTYKVEHDWVNFVKGVILQFEKRGFSIHEGFDLVIEGNIPGGGLSSSSSLELLVAVMLSTLFHYDIQPLEMIKLAQAVENEYMGVNCGIMDQFIIALGKRQHAMLLDTNTLEYEYVPLDLKDHVILIGNTNKKRTLAGSKYNERFSECQRALKILQADCDINSLGDLTIEAFESLKEKLNHEVLRRRVKHAVYENQRTIMAKHALVNGQLEVFGELMNDSHISLRDDYEVSCFELDTMVELMQQQPGVVGSRMTGAGFGGCTVTLIRKDEVEHAVQRVSKAYEEIVGYPGDFHVVTIGDGAHEIVEEGSRK